MSNELVTDGVSEPLPDARQSVTKDRPEAIPRVEGEAGGPERGFASGGEPASLATPPAASSLIPPLLLGAEDPDGLADEAGEGDEVWAVSSATSDGPLPPPPLAGRGRSKPRGRRLVPPGPAAPPLTPEQRLLLLDTWQRSGLPAADFAALVGVSKHTLFAWKQKFATSGPAGLLDAPKGGPKGSRLPDLTKRTILMLKKANPEWGCQRISDMLVRGPALPASPSAVAGVLHEAGYRMEEVPTRPHPDKPREFERAQPNQLWQTDLFTFILKRQNRRVYLVAFMDDHSRFLVGYRTSATRQRTVRPAGWSAA